MKEKFCVKNRQNLMEQLPNNSVVVLFAGIPIPKTADQFYPFLVNKNFFYMTNIAEQNIVLVMQKIDNVTTETIYVERTTEHIRQWEGERFSKEEALEASGIENQAYTDELDANLSRLLHGNKIEYLCLDLERRDIHYSINKAISFAKEMTEKYPYLQVKNIYNEICELRVIKSSAEIEHMRKANEITKVSLESMMKNLAPGVNEAQMESRFAFEIKNNGSKRNSFNTISAGGKNATVLHYDKNNQELKDGDLVLFDLGCEWSEYASDISRTYPVNGKFTKRQKEIYNIVLNTQNEVINMIKPGVLFSDLHAAARNSLAKQCMEIGLIKNEEEILKYYYHGVGHYIGLDVHDVGSYGAGASRSGSRKLEEGMVITVEPGLYIAEEGIGIRIEDDIVVTKKGYDNLSEGIIKTVEDIEKFMSKK